MSMIGSALVIFFLRVIDNSLGTVRLVMVVRGRKGLAGILGFFQALVFVTAIAGVFRDLDNILNILGYAGGFAAGIMLGMAIEERLAIGFGHVRIISAEHGAAVAAALRAGGYGATELIGRGREGSVSVISSTVRRRDVLQVQELATAADPACFVTVDEVRPLRRGFWRS